MKKILVIEDEFNQFESLFNYVNDIYMGNELSFTNVVKSQDLNPFSSLSAYDMVFVDIKLGNKSELDGYGILKKIETDNIPVKKIVIFTGNNKILEMLKARGVTGEYEIVTKPVELSRLRVLFQSV